MICINIVDHFNSGRSLKGSSGIEVIEEQFIKQLVGSSFEHLPESKKKVSAKIISD